MKKILFTLILVIALSSSQSQCITNAVPNIDTIDCGDSVNLIINSFAEQILGDTFDLNGSTDPNWQVTGGAIFTNPYIPSPSPPGSSNPDGGIYFWMGATNVLPNQLATAPLNVFFGGQVCFDMAYAVQGNLAPVEGPDEYDEGITFQYSLDNGVTWIDVEYYAPNGDVLPSNPGVDIPGLTNNISPYNEWTNICIVVPPAGETTATSFRWVQEQTTSAEYDHWGIDNIQILAGNPFYGLFDMDLLNPQASNFLTSNNFFVSPTSDTTYNFLYTNSINDSCTTSATIYLNSTDAGPGIVVACDGIGALLQSDGVAPWSTVSWSPAAGLSDVTNPNPFANPLVDTDYTLTSDCGVDVVSVFVEESFDIDIVQPDTICLNGSSFINLSTIPSSVSIASVEWNFPGTLNPTTGNQVLASPTTTTQYVATVTSDSGCVIQDSTLLVVEGFASAISVTPSDPDVCFGESVVLTAAIEANLAPYTLIQGIYSPFSTTVGDLVTGLGDDNTVGPINIGFNFPFFGNSYNSFWISSNGFMTFSAPTASFNFNLNIPNVAQPNNMIAWGWDDLDFSAGGTVSYYAGGVAPNQYFVINYLDVPHFGFFGASPEISVQVVIYANGLIEINNINVLPDAFGTMTQGIENATGTSGVSDPAINNVAITSIGENWSFVPVTGPVNPVYSWSPPLYLNDTSGAVVTSSPDGDIEYFVTMVDGLCSSTTSVLVNVDSLLVVGDLDYTLECPEDSFQFNVQFETSILNSLSNGPGPCSGGTGIYTLGEVGTGTGTSAVTGTPYEGFYSDGRMQILYTAADLNAAGFTGGEMESIAFNVVLKASTAPYNNFRVAIKPTTLTALTTFDNGGFVQVVNPYSHTTQLGWNTHFFDTPFCWDGVTNLLFEVCFDNTAFTSDDDVATSITSTNTTVFDFADFAAGCALAAPFLPSNQRPDLRFNYENLFAGIATIDAAWSPTASFVDATVENPIALNVGSTSQYPIILTAGSCTTIDTVNVTLPYSFSDDTTVCAGESVQLEANGGANHSWTPDNGTLTSTTIPNPVATPTTTTDYVVSIDLANCSVTDTVTVVVDALPVAAINNGVAEEDVCDGANAELVSDANSSWINDWTGPETGSGVSLTVTTEGSYVLTSTDGNGCVSSSTILVSFNDNPILDPDMVRNILCCNGDEVIVDFASLITNGVGFGEAFWDNSPSASGASATVSSNEDGTYDILVVSSDGCGTNAQVTFQTNCLNLDIVDIDSTVLGASEDYTVNADFPLSNESWAPNFTGSNFLATTTRNDFETVSVVAEAEFSLNDGSLHTCSESDSSQIFIAFLENPEMPDAFTPNGDNLNDKLFPVNLDPSTTISVFKVFNRWGDVVYEYNGDNGWNGTWESEDQSADVYTYYLVIDKVATEFVMSGSVTLIR